MTKLAREKSSSPNLGSEAPKKLIVFCSILILAAWCFAQQAPNNDGSALLQAIAAQANPDPNFAGVGQIHSFSGQALFSWNPDASGMPVISDRRRGQTPAVYLGFDKTGTSYLSGQPPFQFGPTILAVFNRQIHYLMAAPPILMKPGPIPGGVKIADVAVLMSALKRRDEYPTFPTLYTLRPANDASLDPNFYGAGENRLLFWGGDDNGRPAIYSPEWGASEYLGFDAEGNTYLKADEVVFYSYNVKDARSPLKRIPSVPADLSQPPSRKHKLDAAILHQVQVWQATSGPNKDPNFWGIGEDEYFHWDDSQGTGVPKISENHGSAASYYGYEEATGFSYMSILTGSTFFAYLPGRGRPMPVAKLPARLVNVPPRLKDSPFLKGISVTLIQPVAPRSDSAGTKASVAHSGNAWTVSFVDEAGKPQTLPMMRPHLPNYDAATWNDLNKNHLGQGMWLASDAATGKVRIIDVRVQDRGKTQNVERVVIAPAATMAEVKQMLAAGGINLLDGNPAP